jgi:hypothetical protein
MIRWICGQTRRDRVRNNDIRERLVVAPVEKKLLQYRLRWFKHIQQRPAESPISFEMVFPLLFRTCFVPVFLLRWFHLYVTPTYLGIKSLVVVVVSL